VANNNKNFIAKNGLDVKGNATVDNDLTVNGTLIAKSDTPTVDSDVANKLYVDSQIGGISSYDSDLVQGQIDSAVNVGFIEALSPAETIFDLSPTTSGDYTFSGDGFPSNVNDPVLHLTRGKTYKFTNVPGSHPFQIRTSAWSGTYDGGAAAYSDGVTNNGGTDTVEFTVPMDAPNTLYYQCTVHETMLGTIYVDALTNQDLLTTSDVEFNKVTSNLVGSVHFTAKNDEGTALAKGDVVYIKGISGNTPTVAKADADDATKMPAFGVVYSGANDGANVTITTLSVLEGLDTQTPGWSEGDTLYVATVAGELTNTKPTGESSLIQNIGQVTRVDNSAGSIKILGAGRTAATPNLDQNNIFIGNASNQSITMSIDSAVGLTDTHDSAAVLGQINDTVDVAFINALTSQPDFDSDLIPVLELGTDTKGNYVTDISGTTNEIEVDQSTGSVTVGLPDNVTIAGNLTMGGYIAGPTTMTIDPATVGTDSGTLVILGNLQVEGETTTVNSTTVSISDKNIVLADSATNAAQADDAGITINGANATIQYKATGDKWEFNKPLFHGTDRVLTTADDLHDSAAVQGQIDSAIADTLNDTVTITKHSTTDPALKLQSTVSTSDAAPIMEFVRNTDQANNGDYLGQIKFIGEDSSGTVDGSGIVYAKVTGKISDPTDGTEDGLIEYMVKSNGSNLIMARMTGNDGGKLIMENGAGIELDSGGITVGANGNITVAGNTVLTTASDTHDSDLVQGQIDSAVPALARSSVSGNKGLSYNSSNGVFDLDSSNVRGMFTGGTGINYNSGTGEFTTTDADIDHDALTNFDANEHVDHSSVSINAGKGLIGGGDITSSRTLDIDSANIRGFTIDSSRAIGLINDTVTNTFINTLTGVDADTVGGLNPTQFLRSDQSDNMVGTLTVDSDLIVGNTDTFFMDASSGRFGIGQSTPSAPLHIKATTPIIYLEDGNAAGTPLSSINGADGSFVFHADQGNEIASSSITFQIDGSNVVFMDSTGNVGIGTITPTSKLDVNGVINLNSNLITNVSDPVSAQDAATKAYVDASTPSIDGNKGLTYNSGTGVFDLDSANVRGFTIDSARTIGLIDSAYIQPLARAAIVAGSNITYDSDTGVISSSGGGTSSSHTLAISLLDTTLPQALDVGDPVYYDSDAAKWTGAKATTTDVASHIIVEKDGSNFKIAQTGVFTLTPHQGLDINSYYYLLDSAGFYTATQPTIGVNQTLFYALDSSTIDVNIAEAVDLSAVSTQALLDDAIGAATAMAIIF